MEEQLDRRYFALFDAYYVADRPPVAWVKYRLAEYVMSQGTPKQFSLRADAALCLLTLFDTMIIRPYMAPIVTREYPQGIPRPSKGFEPLSSASGVNEVLDTIFDAMRMTNESPPFSSHDVLQGIEAAWPKLASLFGWA